MCACNHHNRNIPDASAAAAAVCCRGQVSSDDAIEGMAYYIALYLARAPEARHMEPKQLQAALRSTFTVRGGDAAGAAAQGWG